MLFGLVGDIRMLCDSVRLACICFVPIIQRRAKGQVADLPSSPLPRQDKLMTPPLCLCHLVCSSIFFSFRFRAATRPTQLSMNEFGMLSEVITGADGQEEGFEAGSGGAGQSYNPLAGTGGGGGSGGPAGGQYRYHGTPQEGVRASAGKSETNKKK